MKGFLSDPVITEFILPVTVVLVAAPPAMVLFFKYLKFWFDLMLGG